METLEFKLPRIKSAEVSVDNHLCGYIETWDDTDRYYLNNFKIPLPDGNWILVHQDKTLIRLIKFD